MSELNTLDELIRIYFYTWRSKGSNDRRLHTNHQGARRRLARLRSDGGQERGAVPVPDHRGFDDPPKLAADASDNEEALGHYRRVRDEIRAFVETLPQSLTGNH